MGTKIYEKIVEQIGALIETGELKSGERLPPERKLAETFQVSRNTIREAIRILVEKGAVVSRTGAGNFVAESASQVMASAMEDAVGKQRHRLKEVFEFRKMIEPQIASLAAERISDETLTTLEEIVLQQEKSLASGQNPAELDELFHRLLVRSTGNSVLFSVYEKLHDILAESRTDELQSPDRTRTSIQTHRELITALKKRDGVHAATTMNQHMQQIEEITNIKK